MDHWVVAGQPPQIPADAVVEGKLGLASPEPGLGHGLVLVNGLVTDVPRLDPLAELEETLGQVQSSRLEQNFPLSLSVSCRCHQRSCTQLSRGFTFQRDFMFQKVDYFLISSGGYFVLVHFEMFGSLFFENFGLQLKKLKRLNMPVYLSSPVLTWHQHQAAKTL